MGGTTTLYIRTLRHMMQQYLATSRVKRWKNRSDSVRVYKPEEKIIIKPTLYGLFPQHDDTLDDWSKGFMTLFDS